VGAFRALSGDGNAGEGFAVFEATVLEEDESALSDELREHAVRVANPSSSREGIFVIELER
jgi:hypothetical protein